MSGDGISGMKKNSHLKNLGSNLVLFSKFGHPAKIWLKSTSVKESLG